jgi:dihydroorotase/N-acyl-D-amino-acid deacylase
MNSRVLVFLVLAVMSGCSADDGEDDESRFDIVLWGGQVFTGENATPLNADVGIRGDRIVSIGDLSDMYAVLRIDVTGLAVVPGFIDIHNHAVRDDRESSDIFRWPDAENLIRQGVTTAIGGPDGSSPLPIAPMLEAIEESPASVNFGTFVGHGSVRQAVVGGDDRDATAEELQRMREEVAQAMEQGSYGMSSGLLYVPGSFANTEEVVELAKVAGKYGGIYISHMRQEGVDILKSVAETIRIGEEGGLPTQITHHKIIGATMWGNSDQTLAMVDAAIERGVDVSIDQYPYTASSTGLNVLFPRWSLDGDEETRMARLQDADTRARIKAEVEFNIRTDRGGNDPANVALADCEWDRTLNGLNLAEVLEREGRAVTIDAAADLVVEMVEAGSCSAVFHAINEEDVRRIMVHPRTMHASDGGIKGPSNQVPHPRNYGTFARVLGYYVREQGVLPFHTAIHKMTRLPADRIGLSDRGRIVEGAIADIAVLDPATIVDRATFEEPHQYAEGAHHVFVNGEPVLLHGEMTGARPGRVLRSTDL